MANYLSVPFPGTFLALKGRAASTPRTPTLYSALLLEQLNALGRLTGSLGASAAKVKEHLIQNVCSPLTSFHRRTLQNDAGIGVDELGLPLCHMLTSQQVSAGMPCSNLVSPRPKLLSRQSPEPKRSRIPGYCYDHYCLST